MTDAPAVHRTDVPSPEAIEQVLELVEDAAAADGFSAINEAALLRIRHPHLGSTHLFVRDADELVGYGQVLRQGQDADPATHPAQGALVVHPQFRRRGLGTALLEAMVDASPAGLEIWATRHTSAAQALAKRVGLVPVRELLIMTRSLTEPVPAPDGPPGVLIRPFRVGQDEEDWLRINARAFASHPEQGSLSRVDLQERMSEPWFDPAGFLLAESAHDTLRQAQGAELLGFHWTKQHPDRLGEVYVLGVDPDAGVRGLGRVLLAAGLAHLRAVGNTQVQLYVDAENLRAVALYERAGFRVASSDVMYASPNAGVDPLTTMLVSSDA